MLTTAEPEWADRARRLREHAMSVSAADRHASVLAPAEQYLEVGFNYRMTDLQAAVGIVQLGRLPEIVDRRRQIAATLRQADRRASPGLRAVADPAYGTCNFQSFWVEVGAAVPGRPGRAAGPPGATPTSRPAAASWRRTGSPRYAAVAARAAAGHRAAHRQHADPAGVPPDDRVRAGAGHRRAALGRARGLTVAPPLLLVAASGLAREVLACLRTHAIAPVIGFLDDDPARQGTLVDGVPVLGGARGRP